MTMNEGILLLIDKLVEAHSIVNKLLEQMPTREEQALLEKWRAKQIRWYGGIWRGFRVFGGILQYLYSQ